MFVNYLLKYIFVSTFKINNSVYFYLTLGRYIIYYK